MADEDFGPLMMALTEKQRRFVLAMLTDPMGSQSSWARTAGYSDVALGARVMACRMLQDDKIRDAIREHSKRHLDVMGPVLGVSVLLEIARDKKHARRLDAAMALCDRSGFSARTEHKVTVEHLDDGRLIEIAGRLAAELGVDRQRLIGGNGVVIEGQAVDDVGEVVDRGDVDSRETGGREAREGEVREADIPWE